MKTFLSFSLSTFIFLLFSLKLSAQQNTYPCLSMEVKSVPVSNYLMSDSSVNYSDSTSFSLQMLINLFDTVNVTNIHVKVGRTLNGSDVINSTYGFNTYRDGYNIVLDLGSYSNLLHYYAEIKLERSDASLTDAITFFR